MITKCMLLAFIVGTHEPVPAFNLGPFGCDEAKQIVVDGLSTSDNYHVYYILRPISEDAP